MGAAEWSRGWVAAQFAAALLCLAPLIGYAHMYAAHESDAVTVSSWAGYALVLSVIWGPAPIGIAGLLALLGRPSRLSIVVGGLGCVAAAVFYFGGLWAFTFRERPHWTLYVAELVGAVGAVLAAAATGMQARAVRQARLP